MSVIMPEWLVVALFSLQLFALVMILLIAWQVKDVHRGKRLHRLRGARRPVLRGDDRADGPVVGAAPRTGARGTLPGGRAH